MVYDPEKDPNYLEWKDSRDATARFDSILIDLRKYGFTLITGLTTASSFLGFSSPDFNLLQGTIMVTLGLIVILYWLDMYYQNLLYGAVIRTLFLELFKLNKYGRRGIASFISNLHSESGIRYVLHGIYYGFLIGLLVLSIFLSTVTTDKDKEASSSINVNLQKDTSMTFEGGRIGPENNSQSTNDDNASKEETPFTFIFAGVNLPIVIVITFVISMVGMIYISVTADRRREKRWKCVCSYFKKKQKLPYPNSLQAQLIENTVYYIFADKKGYDNDAQKNAYDTELSNCNGCS